MFTINVIVDTMAMSEPRVQITIPSCSASDYGFVGKYFPLTMITKFDAHENGSYFLGFKQRENEGGRYRHPLCNEFIIVFTSAEYQLTLH